MGIPEPGPRPIVVVAADVRTPTDSPDHVVDVERWERLALAALRTEGAAGELTLTFVDLTEMAELNLEHMGKVGPTDVLSFPLDDGDDPSDAALDIPVLLGDVVISPAVAAEQFGDHAGTYDDELALLVVHGVLHVLGHDHAEAGERALMRNRESALLSAHHWHGAAPAGFRQEHAD